MIETLQALHALSPAPGVVAALITAAVLLVGSDPVLGRRQHRAFLAELAADPIGAGEVQVRFYRSWARQGWLWAGGVVALVLAAPGVDLADLGLRLPTSLGGASQPFVVGALAGIVGALVGGVVAARRRDGRGRTAPRMAGAAAVVPMLPTTPRARRGWVGLAVTAGLTEEVTYRGLIVLVLALALPGAHPVAVVLVAGTVFGAAHWYQGRAGMIATGALGCLFTAMYLATGSLLVAMVLHVLIDLRPVLTAAPRRPAAATQQQGAERA
ncbi:CPBP family intramembrane glutamic endopeptidase [Pengzhenrongella sicca]|uniref:CPBP family intramembrane metalloprotease n=1 Tax=Pengzhenrongella sicca TaxID=2819238 RepID=A0A8A4ZB92_9MICO|nr:CPBP family intramembrane glutamic endopeptidase [Pengzhenrongella sicca]QTE28681.1 CPBP family intramembrane metalloprotease [Pengzhenrongella sicca]